MTLPKKQEERKLGQLLAGSGHRMMVSTSLWMTARQRASPPPICLRGPMYADGGQRSRGGKWPSHLGYAENATDYRYQIGAKACLQHQD